MAKKIKNRDDALHELQVIAREYDVELAHCRADEILLELLNDDEVRAAWEAVPKWYS